MLGGAPALLPMLVMMSMSVLMSSTLMGCGGGGGGKSGESTTPAAAAAAAEEKATLERERQAQIRRADEWKQLDDARPKSLLKERKAMGLAAKERCGQGPYRVEVAALEAEYSESLEVVVCSPRRISGAYRFTQVQQRSTGRTSSDPSVEESFGEGVDNEECIAGAEERAVVGKGGKGSGSGEGGGGSKGERGGAAARQAEAVSEMRTLEVAAVPAECKGKTSLLHYTWSASRGAPMAKVKLVLELWSAVPNDLRGVVFIVRQAGVAAGTSAEAWAAYQAAEREWYQRYLAFHEREKEAGRVVRIDEPARTPVPPAPRREVPPPRPSERATWVPGYWHLEDGEFHWLAGLWRVPAEDVAAERTARAPRLPPTPRVEAVPQRPPPPSRRAVWTPGSWQWDGGAWIWIDGVWRIPPGAGQRWTPPVWEAIEGGVILRPGGWTIRLGR